MSSEMTTAPFLSSRMPLDGWWLFGVSVWHSNGQKVRGLLKLYRNISRGFSQAWSKVPHLDDLEGGNLRFPL